MNQTKNKSSVRRIIVFSVICFSLFLIGSLAGGAAAKMDWDSIRKTLSETDHQPIGIGILIAHILILVIGLLWGFLTLHHAAADAAKWDGEDEDFINRIESKLYIPIGCTNIVMILNFVLFSCETAYLMAENKPSVMIAIAVMLTGLIGSVVMNTKTVNLEKDLNPEKKGDPLEKDFQKKWLASLDEAEQKTAYQAGFEAFKIGSNACMVLWILLTVTQIFLQTGVLPVLSVGAVWLVMQIVYLKAVYKLEHGKK